MNVIYKLFMNLKFTPIFLSKKNMLVLTPFISYNNLYSIFLMVKCIAIFYSTKSVEPHKNTI